jgi:hypothetical protein
VLASVSSTDLVGTAPASEFTELELAAGTPGIEAAQIHEHRIGAVDEPDHGGPPAVVATAELVDAEAPHPLPGRRAQKPVGANLSAPTLLGQNQGLHCTRFVPNPADRPATNQ